MICEANIREAIHFLRTSNCTIPTETLQFMLDASLEKLAQVIDEAAKMGLDKLDLGDGR